MPHDHQGGQPVMAVDDVRLPVQVGSISKTAREKKKKRSRSFVSRFPGCRNICDFPGNRTGTPLAVVWFRLTDWVSPGRENLKSVFTGEPENAGYRCSRTEGAGLGHRVPGLSGLGQGTGHIRQPADFDQRSSFRGDKKNFHD